MFQCIISSLLSAFREMISEVFPLQTHTRPHFSFNTTLDFVYNIATVHNTISFLFRQKSQTLQNESLKLKDQSHSLSTCRSKKKLARGHEQVKVNKSPRGNQTLK